MAWNSGYTVKARIDAQARVWYGEMKIPFSAIDTHAEKGRELRIGIFRLAGPSTARVQYIWRPSGEPNFHVPKAFRHSSVELTVRDALRAACGAPLCSTSRTCAT